MLNAEQIADLRDAVLHRQRPVDGATVPLRFVGGPLDGIVVKVTPTSSRSQFIGWAQCTDRDLVTVMYERGDGNLRRFRSYESNSRRDERGYGV
ncbi:MAG: hypothetical protein WD768_23285 [Phycisphaeraceae bacterium]